MTSCLGAATMQTYSNTGATVNTVVLFLQTDSSGSWKNKLYTRTLRKIGFIDNRYTGQEKPRANEHWLVDVVRENQSARGGCLILHPIRKVTDYVPLINGMYDLHMDGDVLIIVPHDKTKNWVLSPKAKSSFLEATKANTIVIDHGGTLWPRRKSPESILEKEAKKLLG